MTCATCSHPADDHAVWGCCVAECPCLHALGLPFAPGLAEVEIDGRRSVERMTLRLRFWLLALDLAEALRLPQPVYLWLVGKASDATDWGPGLPAGDLGEDPF